MKKLLLELFKEQATTARINGRYDAFTNSELYKSVSAKDKTKMGE